MTPGIGAIRPRSQALAGAIAAVAVGILVATAGVAFAADVNDTFDRADGTDLGSGWTSSSPSLVVSGGAVTNLTGTHQVARSTTGTGSVVSADVKAGNGLSYDALIVGDNGLGDYYFVKVQTNTPPYTIFDRVFFYTGTGGGYTGMVALTTNISDARMTVSVAGSVVTVTFDTNFDGVVDQSYSHNYGTPPSGTGVAFGVYGPSTLDNFSTALNPTVTSTSAEPSIAIDGGAFDLAVTSPGGTPDGALKVDIAGLATRTVPVVGGVAAADVTGLAPGTYAYTATYTGTSTFQPSVHSGTVTVVPATTTVLAVSPPSVALGASVGLTATVSSAYGTPTGDVAFYDGATLLGTVALAGGEAFLDVAPATPGTHSYSAAFSAAGYGSSSDGADAVAVAETTTALTASAATVAPGDTVGLTATVSSAYGTPTGDVEFYDGTTLVGTVALVAGETHLDAVPAAPGAHEYSAVYVATLGFALSVGSADVEAVTSTTTALVASSASVAPGDTVHLTATVSSVHGTPIGDVSFYDGATLLGTVALTDGEAGLDAVATEPGAHPYTAVFSGAEGFTTSTGTANVAAVGATTTALKASLPAVLPGDSLTLTAKVSSAYGTPQGDVAFYDGATLLGTVSLTDGDAVLKVTVAGTGSHSYRALYAGPVGFSSSTAALELPMVSATAGLAFTGADVVGVGVLAAGALVLGGAALYVRRRRAR